jgi:hypothetical protein
MFRRSIPSRLFPFAALLFAALHFASPLHSQDSNERGRKYKAPPPTSRVEVTVVRATNGKPVENAAVIFHPLVDGRDSGNMELKTNDEGKTVIDLLNLNSTVRLQVVAPGFQTYGEDWKIDKDNMAIEIKLKRPVPQFSTYKASEAAPAPAESKPAVDPAIEPNKSSSDSIPPPAKSAEVNSPEVKSDEVKAKDDDTAPKDPDAVTPALEAKPDTAPAPQENQSKPQNPATPPPQ